MSLGGLTCATAIDKQRSTESMANSTSDNMVRLKNNFAIKLGKLLRNNIKISSYFHRNFTVAFRLP